MRGCDSVAAKRQAFRDFLKPTGFRRASDRP